MRVARLYTVNRFRFAQRALSFLAAHFLENSEKVASFDNIFLKALHQSFSRKHVVSGVGNIPVVEESRAEGTIAFPCVRNRSALRYFCNFLHNRTRRRLGNELLYLGLEFMHVRSSITVKSFRTAHTPGGRAYSFVVCLSYISALMTCFSCNLRNV